MIPTIRMMFKTAQVAFWSLVIALLGARIALHDQIALGTFPGEHVVAWLRTLVG